VGFSVALALSSRLVETMETLPLECMASLPGASSPPVCSGAYAQGYSCTPGVHTVQVFFRYSKNPSFGIRK